MFAERACVFDPHPLRLAELEGRLRGHMQRLAVPEAQLRWLRLDGYLTSTVPAGAPAPGHRSLPRPADAHA